MEVGNDFADLFEVKDALKKKGSYYHRIDDNRLVVGYCSAPLTSVRRGSPPRPLRPSMSGKFTFAGNSRAARELEDRARRRGGTPPCERPARSSSQVGQEGAARHGPRAGQVGLDGHPVVLNATGMSSKVTYRRSLVDLAALRFTTQTMPDRYLPAAGLPWFMTMFGRDSIITSLQTLPFVPELAATTLRADARITTGFWAHSSHH